MRRRVSWQVAASLSVWLLAFMPSPAMLSAQDALPSGSRIRLTGDAQASVRVIGTLVALEPSAVVVEAVEPASLRGRAMSFSFERITKLEVSEGSKSKAWTGALIGGGIGVAGGFVALAAGRCSGSDCSENLSWGEAALIVVPIAAAVGTGIGALIGSQVKSERWEEVTLGRLRVSAAPTFGKHPAVSVSVRLR